MSLLISSHDVPATVVTGDYDPLLVLLSYVVATVAAYVAISILQWIQVKDIRKRVKGISIGAVVMGGGIWAMHFTGMLAYHTDVFHTYDTGLTILSLAIAILFSWAVFFNITAPTLTVLRVAVSAPLMGAGVATMHYVGMQAMRMQGELHYVAPLFWLSIGIAVVASGAAMGIMRGVAVVKHHRQTLHVLAAMVLGGAVCGMHYTGMAAMVLIPTANCRFDAHQNYVLFASIVALVAFLVIFGGYFYLLKSIVATQESSPKLERTSLIALVILIAGLVFAVHYDEEEALISSFQPHDSRSSQERQTVDSNPSVLPEMTIQKSSEQLVTVRRIEFSHHVAYGIIGILALLLFTGIRLTGRHARRLDQEQQKLQTVLKTVMEGIITIDSNGLISRFNPVAEKIFGYKSTEVIGKNVSLLMPQSYAQLHDAHIGRYKETGWTNVIGSMRRVDGLRRDGSVFPMELAVNVMHDATGKMTFVGSVRDITERLRLEEVLRQERDRAEAATRAKSLFLANMSHEIRTPMNGILGVSSLLKDMDLTPKQRECADIIENSAKTLLMIINEILDYSKIEANKVVLENTAFNIVGDVMEQIQLLQPMANGKSIYLNASIGEDIPPYVYGDALRFHQVLLNIIGNALKFTAKGGVTVAVDRLPAAEGAVLIKVAVTDTGSGIPKDKQGQLFEPFYQVSSGTTKGAVGTGLGLAISKNLVALMGGEIHCESEEGQGATFWFTAHFSVPSEGQIAAEVERVQNLSPNPAFAHKHILVAEDVVTNQFVIKRILKSLDCTFDIAENGEEAVAFAKNGTYDAILMDCHMPVMDGYDATRYIRDHGKKGVIVIALTANASQADRELCLSVGMDDFISKPFTKGDVVRVLNKWFEEKHEF